jgi:hypothetical protein
MILLSDATIYNKYFKTVTLAVRYMERYAT